jgi:phosphotransferase system enzyme I (PtsI)
MTDPTPHPEPTGEQRLEGAAVSPGIGIGKIYKSTESRPTINRRTIDASETDAELARLDAAVKQSLKQLEKLRNRLAILPEDSQGEITPLIDAYIRMLGPSRLIRGTTRRITEQLTCAEAAVIDESTAIAAALTPILKAGVAEAAATDTHAGRQADEVREIGRRLLRNLTHTPYRTFHDIPEGAIFIAEGLRPSDAALLDPARIAGVATDEGGTDGHTAVMLRALGIPAILGAAGISLAARAGQIAVLDGGTGFVALDPSADTLARARRSITAHAREAQRLARLRHLPATTTDDTLIELQANFELPAELPLIANAGARGIGLLRSEFLFMNRDTLPDEDSQTTYYRSVIEAMDGDPVTIRVLDWGGEKEIEVLETEGLVPMIADTNPALGLRGIRLLLRQPALFETQLAAILRAAVAGPTRVLLPMVTALSEIRASRAIYEAVAARLRATGTAIPDPLPPLGIMIETPGAALSADAMILETDFFALGTNDLAMYTLAIDRGETDLAHLYSPMNPAVLRLVQFTTQAAIHARKPVSVCGEMAANPRLTPLLVGLGVRSLSMNPAALPRVKQTIRNLSADACRKFANDVMREHDPDRIEALFARFESA